MNRRDLFRLAGAVAVAPRAMLAAPVAPVSYLPSGMTLAAWQAKWGHLLASKHAAYERALRDCSTIVVRLAKEHYSDGT